jgi:hypothetical protein
MILCCRILVPLLLLANVVSTLRVYPHQLAYFNELAGGPENGHKHLLGTNLDWGQNWLYLKDWTAHQMVHAPLKVYGMRFYDPASIGMANASAGGSAQNPAVTFQWTAVTVNELQKRAMLSPVRGKNHPKKDNLSVMLQGQKPVNQVAFTIYIYCSNDSQLPVSNASSPLRSGGEKIAMPSSP